MKRIVGIFILAIGIFGLSSCLEEISFTQPEAIDDGIAIQGKLVKGDPSIVSVTLRKTFDFAEAARLINAREVTIINESNNELELKSNADGVFTLEIPADHPDFKVEYGNSFKLKVATFDNRVFESEFESLSPVPQPDNLEVKKTQIVTKDVNGNEKLFDQLTYTVSTPLAPEGIAEKTRILWEMVSTYRFSDTPEAHGQRACRPTQIEEENKTCYLTSAPVTNYVVLNGQTLSMDRVDNYEILNANPTPIYSEGLYLTVLQQSLSPTAFEYWSQVNQVVDRTGDIFQSPVGKVITNFKSMSDPDAEVYGYFYVTEEKVQRVFVSPELAGNPPKPCPAIPNDFGQVSNDCCNCLTITNSSREKPEWWTE